ncbi:MAG: rhomboid family intramembrane serine protease [Pirellulaceae bacterium]
MIRQPGRVPRRTFPERRTFMGIYDRGYYDGDQWRGDGQGGGGRSSFKQSAIASIILINVIVFVIDMFAPRVSFQAEVTLQDGTVGVQTVESNSHWVSFNMALKHKMTEVGYAGPLENPLFAYQLLTYGFAHSSIDEDFGIWHIAFNMLTLFFLGVAVEQKYGRTEFLKFYILAILVAGTVWLLVQVLRSQPASAVGASGAVAAVVMLFILNFPKQTLLLMGIIPMPAWVLGVLFIGMDVLNSMNHESRIAAEAHLAGAAFAAIYYFGKWNFQWLKFDWLTDRLSGKPKLKVHQPEASDELTREADIILDKVHRLGEESLTRKERKTLERYSKTVRKGRDN